YLKGAIIISVLQDITRRHHIRVVMAVLKLSSCLEVMVPRQQIGFVVTDTGLDRRPGQGERSKILGTPALEVGGEVEVVRNCTIPCARYAFLRRMKSRNGSIPDCVRQLIY